MINKKIALVTGAAGFIGFHTSLRLLQEGWTVLGLDSFSDYYDVLLKKSREKLLLNFSNFISIKGKIEEKGLLSSLIKKNKPEIIVHLAAQAGVRYSTENPRSYIDSNIVGTFELLESAKLFPPKHMLIASTSSVYGSNSKLPFYENDKSDNQLSIYAATKKSCENIAHSYSHLFGLPITIFRFFTVYGPWGRPDMALFKFTNAILNNQPIDVYNYGEMQRDFTYIDDLVIAIYKLISKVPEIKKGNISNFESLSSVAPFRVVNIGNSNTIKLIEFIKVIEQVLKKQAQKNLIEIQKGDITKTLASTDLLNQLIGFSPKTDIREGIKKFIDWYLDYYNIKI